ncbi:hypothetical protein VTN00DRAFT_7480 [Thermoascus crustaceus]|uniref:uncharacterized protein n=1 Tax=Thermoascus crustaceus TaxID=5088 RepID=UPI0037447FB7
MCTNDLFLDYLDQFMTVFINNILVYSENELEHQEHVIKILNRLREAELQADIKKCKFHITQTKYLGFIVGTNGIEIDPKKNLLANALSRQPVMVEAQNSLKKEYQTQQLLKTEWLDPQIMQEIGISQTELVSI